MLIEIFQILLFSVISTIVYLINSVPACQEIALEKAWQYPLKRKLAAMEE